MTNKWQIITAICLLIPANIFSQEVFTGLLSNKQLSDRTTVSLLKSTKAADTLILPFIDDFSGDGPYPSADLWADRWVYINNTFSTTQITHGVATFDCLDDYGKLYDNVASDVFAADTLTSRPVDLTYSSSDSIYFSFLWEAGGLGDLPENDDSLTLSFWSPGEAQWYHVWQAPAERSAGFHHVMIPVKASRFLQKGFRFRFINYASLSGIVSEPSLAGNADQWNIDYVHLDVNRTFDDTVYTDVAMTLPLRSLVKGYEAMPWRQFKQAYLSVMSPTANLIYRNNDNIIRNVTRHITIRDVYKDITVRDLDAGATNVDPLTDITYSASLLYTFTSTAGDSTLFHVSSYLITDDFDPKGNDTLTFYQDFNNYFAIDDGTAEAGYGVSGQGSRNAMVALKFRSYVPDSVSAISICFNDAYNNANQRSFYIMVWSDNNGAPGTLLGSTEGPVAAPAEENNGFVTWHFDTPVSVSGNFWIGWKQLSETFLNAGLDMNTPHDGRMYFCLNGVWQLSQAPGTVMMRPLMVGDGTGTSSGTGTLFNDIFSVYPNPAQDNITLVASDEAPEDYVIEIYDLRGSKVKVLSRTENIDISMMSAGTYILRIRTVTGIPVTLLRLVKTN